MKLTDSENETGHEKLIILSPFQKNKPIHIPVEILSEYLSAEEIAAFQSSNVKISSITVYAEKPAKDDRKCCEPGSGCC